MVLGGSSIIFLDSCWVVKEGMEFRADKLPMLVARDWMRFHFQAYVWLTGRRCSLAWVEAGPKKKHTRRGSYKVEVIEPEPIG